MKLSLEGLGQRAAWESAGIELPKFDVAAMRGRTKEAPVWVHFGAGNIFRAFLCAAMQRVLDAGAFDRGVIACETYDGEIIERAYDAFDNLSVLAVLRADEGNLSQPVAADGYLYRDGKGV